MIIGSHGEYSGRRSGVRPTLGKGRHVRPGHNRVFYVLFMTREMCSINRSSLFAFSIPEDSDGSSLGPIPRPSIRNECE